MSETSLIIDFESLDTRPSAVFTEIGAIAVHRESFTEIDSLDLRPSFFDQLSLYRTTDPDTIKWAKDKRVLPTHTGNIGFRQAIERLVAFINLHNPHRIWAWGKDFERNLLEDAASQLGIVLPDYQYRRFACARDHFQTAFGMEAEYLPRPHHAFQDCRDELRDIHSALKSLDRLSAF